MKFQLIICAVLAVAVSHVVCEKCTVNGDCTLTQCASGWHVICQHPADTGVVFEGGTCTCAIDDVTCTTQADCIAITYPCISDAHKHCYDGKCICSHF